MSELPWLEVVRRFAEARNWWVCTTGAGGPHSVPLWGVVLDDVLKFYGDPGTVRSRNLAADPRLVLHLEDGEAPLIVHGRAEVDGLAHRSAALVEAYRAKYRREHDHDYLLETPYAAAATAYRVIPTRAMAWEVTALDRWEVRRWRAAHSG